MTESSLAKSIDRLAEKRAAEIIQQLRTTLDFALKPHWRPKDANQEHIGEDIKAVLLSFANAIETGGDRKRTQPSPALINACRTQVLSELLNGLPKLGELVQLAEQPDYE